MRTMAESEVHVGSRDLLLVISAKSVELDIYMELG